ncbi:MAG: iron chelate uptake ABC transporter family permease subunit [Alkalibacterium sp.]|nr:iron chelate uptake ABC transporter family permease subunit [Alkalibacterium sp.]
MSSTKRKTPVVIYSSLMLLLIGISVVSLFTGVQDISIRDIFQLTEVQKLVLVTTRIPRTISLILAGSTLAVSGLLMQQLTQNKFVSPTTAGTMASARLGIVVAMIYFSHTTLSQKTGVAFLFSLLGTFVFTLFIRTVKNKKAVMIPLVGLMFGNIVNSLSTYLAVQYEIVQNASSWMQGNFALISSNNYQLLFLSVPLFLIIYLLAHYFTIMGLGKDVSTELGIPYALLELIGITVVSLATSAIILTVGSIPFVGIVIPNLVSLSKGDHFGKILFPTAFFGALFLLFSDILSRTLIFPYEIPISLIIGVVGSVLFLFLLLRGESQ